MWKVPVLSALFLLGGCASQTQLPVIPDPAPPKPPEQLMIEPEEILLHPQAATDDGAVLGVVTKNNARHTETRDRLLLLQEWARTLE